MTEREGNKGPVTSGNQPNTTTSTNNTGNSAQDQNRAPGAAKPETTSTDEKATKDAEGTKVPDPARTTATQTPQTGGQQGGAK